MVKSYILSQGKLKCLFCNGLLWVNYHVVEEHEVSLGQGVKNDSFQSFAGPTLHISNLILGKVVVICYVLA